MADEQENEEYGGEPMFPEDEAVFESEPLQGWQKKCKREDVCPCQGMTNCQLYEG
jgi:hypothetical protein